MEALKKLIAELQAVEAILETNKKDPTIVSRLEDASDELLEIIHKVRSDAPNPTPPDDDVNNNSGDGTQP